MSKRIVTSKLLALPLIGLAVVSHHSFPETSPLDVLTEVSGFFLLTAAALGRIWSSAFICGRKNLELVTEGPYSMVRNPLYFFSFLGFVGAGLAFESFTLAAAFGMLFLLTHWPAMRREETKLSGTFGETFLAYTQTVPRFVPNPWKLRQPETVVISSTLFSRAVMESMLVLAIYLAAELIERIHVDYPALVLVRLP